MPDKSEPAKKAAAKPEPVEEAPVKAEEKPVEKKAAAPAAPEPEPAVHAGGHVLTEDKGWVPEEGL